MNADVNLKVSGNAKAIPVVILEHLDLPSIGYAVSEYTPDFYYGFNFSVVQITSGINLGGEVKGFFPNYAHRINIYLSKAINIGPLAKYKTSLP